MCYNISSFFIFLITKFFWNKKVDIFRTSQFFFLPVRLKYPLNENRIPTIDMINIIIRIRMGDYNVFWCYTVKLNCIPTSILHSVMFCILAGKQSCHFFIERYLISICNWNDFISLPEWNKRSHISGLTYKYPNVILKPFIEVFLEKK